MTINQKQPTKRRKRVQIFFKVLFALTVVFILQSRVRGYFFDEDITNSTLSDSLYVEQTLTEQSETKQRNIVPCSWYDKDGVLSPTIAGMSDGAYQSCVAIKDIAWFMVTEPVEVLSSTILINLIEKKSMDRLKNFRSTKPNLPHCLAKVYKISAANLPVNAAV